MIEMLPAVPLGTVAAQSVRVLGVIPDSGPGLRVRAMDIFLATEIALGPSDYWQFELGVMGGGGSFTARTLVAVPYRGFAKGRNRIELRPVVGYSSGEVVALRATPRGSPATLTGCDVVLTIEEP